MNPWARDLFWLPYNIWISSNLQQVGKFADPAAGKTDTVATTEAQLASQNQRRCFKAEGSKTGNLPQTPSFNVGIGCHWCRCGTVKMVFHLGLSNLRTRTSSSCPLRVDLKVDFCLFGNLEGWFLDVFQDKIWFMMVYEFMAIYLKDE